MLKSWFFLCGWRADLLADLNPQRKENPVVFSILQTRGVSGFSVLKNHFIGKDVQFDKTHPVSLSYQSRYASVICGWEVKGKHKNRGGTPAGFQSGSVLYPRVSWVSQGRTFLPKGLLLLLLPPLYGMKEVSFSLFLELSLELSQETNCPGVYSWLIGFRKVEASKYTYSTLQVTECCPFLPPTFHDVSTPPSKPLKGHTSWERADVVDGNHTLKNTVTRGSTWAAHRGVLGQWKYYAWCYNGGFMCHYNIIQTHMIYNIKSEP